MFFMSKMDTQKMYKRVKKQYLYGQRQDSLTCFCLDCNELFPFHNLENEALLYIFSELSRPSDFENMYLKCYKYNNVDFLQPSDNLRDFDVEINPDNNIYLNAETDCLYVSTEQTNNFLKSNDGLSIMQINSRSLNKKLINLIC